MIEDAIERTFDGLASELREVEESIAILIASDAFIEDLISYHARRHFLLAAIADQRAICREKFARLDAPRKTPAKNALRNRYEYGRPGGTNQCSSFRTATLSAAATVGNGLS